MITELEKLCYPVFQCLCNYWQLSCITNMVEKERFLTDITGALKDAKDKAAENPQLEREFFWIEKPIVFFIDYIVKEGRFAFREEWRELSRNYNELSGDEKFFDILSETLENPDFGNSFILFYIMLGLGFDGSYRYNHKHIEQCMRLCMEKAQIDFDIYSESVSPSRRKKHFFKGERRLSIRVALLASAVFMIICFIINIIVFAYVTNDYRSLLKRTAAGSYPHTNYLIEEGRR